MKSIAISFCILSLLLCCKTQRDFNHDTFEIGVSKGIVDDREINEASGLAASIKNTGMLWTHNDSGGEPWVYMIDEEAKHRATVHLEGIKNRDWEDIAVGPGPDEKAYVFIGEIGDNLAQYKYKYIYRFEEPVVNVGDTPVDISITKFDSIKFQLPDGQRDTEAIMVDPGTKDIYIFSKREPKEVNLYVLPFPQSTTSVITAQFVMHIPYTLIVGADISTDGTEILVKNYDHVYYWRRNATHASIEETLKQDPKKLPYAAEPQGEAITFDRTGNGYYTISEESQQKLPHLMFYQRKSDD